MDTREKDLAYWELEEDRRVLVSKEVAAGVPELVAVCEIEVDEETGEPVAGEVCAWGMVFPGNRSEIVSLDGSGYFRGGSLGDTMHLFALCAEVGVVRCR